MRLFFKKPLIMSPHISDKFIAHIGSTDLAILLNKDTFEPDPMVFAFKEDSTSKGTWGMVLLIVRALLRRPSLSGTPTVTFCSVHIHNVVAKKRDAAPTIRFCGDLVRWKTTIVSALGFSSCPSAHVNGESTLTVATSTTTPS